MAVPSLCQAANGGAEQPWWPVCFLQWTQAGASIQRLNENAKMHLNQKPCIHKKGLNADGQRCKKLYPAYEAFQSPMTEVDAKYPSNTVVPSSCSWTKGSVFKPWLSCYLIVWCWERCLLSPAVLPGRTFWSWGNGLHPGWAVCGTLETLASPHFN